MFPGDPIDNVCYCVLIDTLAARYARLGFSPGIAGKNIRYIGVSKFSLRVFLAWCASALEIHVMHILLMSARKEMGWVTARRIVASMANLFPLGHGIIVDFIAKNMSAHSLSVHRDSPISFRSSVACPFPAFIWATFIHVFPEQLNAFVSSIVATNKALMLALHYARLLITARCDWCDFSASTHAQAGWIRRGGYNIFSCIMAKDKFVGLPLDMPSSSVGLFCDRHRLSTTAHAETGGIRRGNRGSPSTAVSDNVLHRLSLDVSSLLFVSARERRGPSTTAVAVTVWNFVKWEFGLDKICGIIGHVNRSFQRLNEPGTLERCPVFL